MRFDDIRCKFQCLRLQPVIGIHKINILPQSLLQASGSGPGNSAILLMDHAHPLLSFFIGITDRTTVIRGTVIHQDQFPGRIALPENALHTVR